MDAFQITSTVVKLFIVLVSSLMTYKFFMKYRESLSRAALFLFIFQLMFTITYFFQFLIPILYDPAIAVVEKGSSTHRMLSGLTFTLFASFEVLFMSLFSFDVYNPERTKYLALIPLVITCLYTYVYFRYGNVLQHYDGFYEWIASPQLQLMTEILAIFSFLPGAIFLMYSIKVKRDRKRGLLLASGFLIIALFVYLFDNLSIQPPNIIVRRLFILVGLILIWRSQ